ncbi:MAG: hypothetical protein J5J00_15870 [Deltaproteobacteria bacterium]|nr:hypothetical protein [Deltaproteobacteria bacterium]
MKPSSLKVLPQILLSIVLLGYLLRHIDFFRFACEPAGDYPLLLLEIEKAKSFESFTGPYSRFGFRYPGPMQFYLQALFQPLLFFSFTSFAKAAMVQLLLNFFFLFMATAAVHSYRRSALDGIVFVLVALYVLTAGTAERMYDIWNPHIIIAPCVSFLMSAAAFAGGMTIFAFPAALSATMVLQSHLSGTIPIVIVSIAAIIAAIKVRRTGSQEKFSRGEAFSVLAAIVIAVLAWVPPSLEALTFAGFGNMGDIVRFSLQAGMDHDISKLARYLVGFFLKPLGLEASPLSLLLLCVVLLIPFLEKYDRGTPYYWLRLFFYIGVVSLAITSLKIQGRLFSHVLSLTNAFVIVLYFMTARAVCIYLSKGMVGAIMISVVLPAGLYIFIFAKIALQPPQMGRRCMTDNSKLLSRLSPEFQKRQVISINDPDSWGRAAKIALQLYRAGYDLCIKEPWVYMFGREISCDYKSRREPRDSLQLNLIEVSRRPKDSPES